MKTSYLTGTDDILQYSVRLKEKMLAIGDRDLLSHERINERQVGQFAVEEIWQRLKDLAKRRFADEHTVEDPVRRVCVSILLDATTRIGSVSDVHREEPVIHRLLAIHGKHHVLRLMLHDSPDQTEDIVHVVRTEVVLKRFCFFAA